MLVLFLGCAITHPRAHRHRLILRNTSSLKPSPLHNAATPVIVALPTNADLTILCHGCSAQADRPQPPGGVFKPCFCTAPRAVPINKQRSPCDDTWLIET